MARSLCPRLSTRAAKLTQVKEHYNYYGDKIFTCIYAIPDIDEAHTLNATLSTQPLRGASASSSSLPDNLSSLGLIKLELARKSIADSGSTFTVEAYLGEIRTENLAYKACENEACKKKVTEKASGGYECRSCGPVAGFRHRYIMKASICDETDHQWVTAFDDAAREIFGTGADELMQLRYVLHVQSN